MFGGLLSYSLERIESLYHFYTNERPAILKKAQKGMEVNRLGHIADLYFYLLHCGKADHEQFKPLQRYIEKYLEVVVEEDENDKKHIQYSFKDIDALKKKGIETNLEKAYVAYSKFEDMPIIHANNTLVMLITRFEEFIANFFNELFRMFPEKYLNEKTISFSEIVGKDIDSIRNKIIDRTIDIEMRKSYVEWFKLLETHNMKFDACCAELGELEEIYVRRNVVVHNSGQVTEAYLDCVGGSDLKLGDKITPDEVYLENAFASIRTIICSIMLEACRLISDKAEYLDAIFDIAFEQLQSKHYKTCLTVFKALYSNKHCDSDTKIMSQINCWIAQKELFGLESIAEEVKNFDTKVLDKIYLLAKELLLEKNDNATAILEDLFSKDEMDSTSVEEWPLFMHYRETAHYDEFKQRHREAFTMSSFELKRDEAILDEDTDEAIRTEFKEKKLA